MSMFLTSDGPIRFPGLGLSLDHLAEGFEVFGLHISLSGILVAVAMFLGLFVTERLAKKTGQDAENYLDLAIRVVIAGLLGARIGYVLSHWEMYVYDQASVFDLGSGGYSFMGALLGGFLATIVFCRKKKISWVQVCDTAIPGIVLAQLVGSVGSFIERSALGTYSEGRFAMQVHMADVDTEMMRMSRSSARMVQGEFLQVHPVALYEIFLLAFLLIGVFVVWKFQKVRGIVFGIYMILYGGINFCMEFILLDSVKLLGLPLSLEQIASLCFIICGISLVLHQSMKHRLKINARPKNYN